MPDQHTDVFVVAKRALVSVRKKDSGINLLFDEPEAVTNPAYTGLVKWGNHPLGGSWLIRLIFHGFEKLADVQMLAMLSCFFADDVGTHNKSTTSGRPDILEDYPSETGPPVPYWPSEAVALSRQAPLISVSISPDRSRTSNSAYGSFPSSDGLRRARDGPTSEPTTPYTASSGSPLVLSRSSSHRNAGGLPKSVSPDTKPPGVVAATSSFAASVWARPFQLAHSPPGRTRRSPQKETGSSLPSGPGTAVTWGPTIFHSSNATMRRSFLAQEIADGFSDASSTDEDEPSTPTDLVVKVTLKNQHLFDDEGHADVPLLAPVDERRGVYAAYREAYARQLMAWGLVMQATEIRKFNAGYLLSARAAPPPVVDDAASQITMTAAANSKQSSENQTQSDTIPGLDLARVCTRCSHVCTPIGGVSRCTHCGSEMRVVVCGVCRSRCGVCIRRA